MSAPYQSTVAADGPLGKSTVQTRRAAIRRVIASLGSLLLLLSVGLVAVPTASAAAIALCVPSAGGQAVTTPKSGACRSGSALKSLASQSDLDAAKTRIGALESLLAGITRSPVNGYTTLRISGENVQIVNGSGSETTTNGLGNLVVGYNDAPGSQSGSHNVILGRGQTVASWGSLVGGQYNESTGALQVLFGDHNNATGSSAGVLGGYGNWASGAWSSVSGGCENIAGATGKIAASGICTQPTADAFQTVSAGLRSAARGAAASIGGGFSGVASGYYASIAGGSDSSAGGTGSAIGGGANNSSPGDYGSISGGFGNTVSGFGLSAILGGFGNTVGGGWSAILGGRGNTVTGNWATLLGGQNRTVSTDYDHVP